VPGPAKRRPAFLQGRQKIKVTIKQDKTHKNSINMTYCTRNIRFVMKNANKPTVSAACGVRVTTGHNVAHWGCKVAAGKGLLWQRCRAKVQKQQSGGRGKWE